jgi:hypothetical protein
VGFRVFINGDDDFHLGREGMREPKIKRDFIERFEICEIVDLRDEKHDLGVIHNLLPRNNKSKAKHELYSIVLLQTFNQ